MDISSISFIYATALSSTSDSTASYYDGAGQAGPRLAAHARSVVVWDRALDLIEKSHHHESTGVDHVIK